MFVDYMALTIILIFSTFLFGFLYAKINGENSKIIQKTFGWNIFCIISCVGTIIHELSHLIISLIFLHKPIKVELFRPKKGKIDGQLGSVQHAYKKTKYRTAGNFFIGSAPMFCGSLVSIGLLNLIGITDLHINTLITQIKEIDLKNPIIWAIFFIIFSIIINMDMSPADMKNSLIGSISLIVLIGSIYFFIKAFNLLNIENLYDVYFLFVNKYLYLLFLGVIMCSITLSINFMISFLIKIIKKK